MIHRMLIILVLCSSVLCSQAFAANAIRHVALSDSCDGGAIRSETSKLADKADSGAINFNPLYLSGGFYRDELKINVRATTGTCYLVVDNKYSAGQDVDVWLSSDGEGGRDGGDVEKYVWALPDSLAISAGAATTTVENFVYLTYNGGSPALKRHAVEDQLGVEGDFLDSMILITNVGLGAVSGADEEVRYFNADQPSFYKTILRSTFHGHHPQYHSGIAPTIESKSFAATRGFLHSGPEECLIPSVNTDNVSLYVPVYNDSNYARWDSLDNFAEYSSGEAIGVPHYFWVVIWGAISNDTTQYKLYMNIQAGTNTYLTRESAEQDKYNMLPTDIPDAFHTTGFLIAGIIINNDEVQALEDGSTYLDLRGFTSGTRGGGGAPPTDSAQIDAWNFVLPPEIHDSLDAHWAIFIDDVPDAGDFGAATDLDANGALNTACVADNEIDYSAVTLTDFDYQTAFTVFYSNTDGDVTELALGADGTYLRSNGASANPSFTTPGGAGDVTDVIGGDGLVDDGNTGAITVDLQIGSWPLDLNADSVWLDSNEIVTWPYWTAAYDSVDNWNNLVNDDRDSVLAFSPIVSEAKDSLTSWANEVNAATDSLTSWANKINADVVWNDGDTLTGTYVFSSAFRGASATAESAYVTIETIEDSLALRHKYGDTLSTAFAILNPEAANDFPFWQTKRAITIINVSAVSTAGTNVIGALDEYNATGTSVDAAVDGDWTVTTSEYTDASFTNAGIDAGDWIGWHTTSVSGSVTTFSITFEYTETY